MSILTSNNRDLRKLRRPIWTDRCTCRHVAASHGPTRADNLTGACLIPLCECGTFRPVTP